MPGPLTGALTAGAPVGEIAGLPALLVEAFRIGLTLQVSVAVPLTCPRQLSSPAVEEISNLSGVSCVGARGQFRRSAPVCLSNLVLDRLIHLRLDEPCGSFHVSV